MITKGVTQEQKLAQILSIPNTTYVGSTEVTIYKRKMDFSKIDKIYYTATGKLDDLGSGTGHFRIYVGGVEQVDAQYPDTTTTYNDGSYDASGDTGTQELKITLQGGTDQLILTGCYVGIVDS